MYTAPDTFEDLIGKWGIAQFANDLGLSHSTANAMKQRKQVNARYWPRIVAKAKDRGIEITPADLVAMQAKRSQEAA